MSLTYFSSKENKENQYGHEVQISPQRGSKINPRNLNLPLGNQNETSKKWKEDEVVSSPLLKQRKQLVELWLNPVISHNTSLELMVEEDECPYQCSCLKEHLLD